MLRTPAPLSRALGITSTSVGSEFEYASLAELEEGPLVNAILADRDYRWRFLAIPGLPENPEVLTELDLRKLGVSGDIDLLAVNREIPEHAAAIQVKRIKVTSSTFQSGKPNKLAALNELYRQTNLLVELGFAQVLSYAIVVVDSRAQNAGSLIYNGLTESLKTTINDALTGEGLHSVAGLTKFEIVQSMDDRPLGAGTFAGLPIRPPGFQTQSAKVTKWVIEMLEERDA